MEKISVKELVQQIKVAMSDLFIAQISQEDTSIRLDFGNGQVFSLCVVEK